MFCLLLFLGLVAALQEVSTRKFYAHSLSPYSYKANPAYTFPALTTVGVLCPIKQTWHVSTAAEQHRTTATQIPCTSSALCDKRTDRHSHRHSDVIHTKLSTPKCIPFDQETVSWERESYELNKSRAELFTACSHGMYKEKRATGQRPCILHNTGYGSKSYNGISN
jgi:hypothetical protein